LDRRTNPPIIVSLALREAIAQAYDIA
jgi:hypothetical protein